MAHILLCPSSVNRRTNLLAQLCFVCCSFVHADRAWSQLISLNEPRELNKQCTLFHTVALPSETQSEVSRLGYTLVKVEAKDPQDYFKSITSENFGFYRGDDKHLFLLYRLPGSFETKSTGVTSNPLGPLAKIDLTLYFPVKADLESFSHLHLYLPLCRDLRLLERRLAREALLRKRMIEAAWIVSDGAKRESVKTRLKDHTTVGEYIIETELRLSLGDARDLESRIRGSQRKYLSLLKEVKEFWVSSDPENSLRVIQKYLRNNVFKNYNAIDHQLLSDFFLDEDPGGSCTAQTALLTAIAFDLDVFKHLPPDKVFAIQDFSDHRRAVIYDPKKDDSWDLTYGSSSLNNEGPIYKANYLFWVLLTSGSFYYPNLLGDLLAFSQPIFPRAFFQIRYEKAGIWTLLSFVTAPLKGLVERTITRKQKDVYSFGSSFNSNSLLPQITFKANIAETAEKKGQNESSLLFSRMWTWLSDHIRSEPADESGEWERFERDFEERIIGMNETERIYLIKAKEDGRRSFLRGLTELLDVTHLTRAIYSDSTLKVLALAPKSSLSKSDPNSNASFKRDFSLKSLRWQQSEADKYTFLGDYIVNARCEIELQGDDLASYSNLGNLDRWTFVRKKIDSLQQILEIDSRWAKLYGFLGDWRSFFSMRNNEKAELLEFLSDIAFVQQLYGTYAVCVTGVASSDHSDTRSWGDYHFFRKTIRGLWVFRLASFERVLEAMFTFGSSLASDPQSYYEFLSKSNRDDVLRFYQISEKIREVFNLTPELSDTPRRKEKLVFAENPFRLLFFRTLDHPTLLFTVAPTKEEEALFAQPLLQEQKAKDNPDGEDKDVGTELADFSSKGANELGEAVEVELVSPGTLEKLEENRSRASDLTVEQYNNRTEVHLDPMILAWLINLQDPQDLLNPVVQIQALRLGRKALINYFSSNDSSEGSSGDSSDDSIFSTFPIEWLFCRLSPLSIFDIPIAKVKRTGNSASPYSLFYEDSDGIKLSSSQPSWMKGYPYLESAYQFYDQFEGVKVGTSKILPIVYSYCFKAPKKELEENVLTRSTPELVLSSSNGEFFPYYGSKYVGPRGEVFSSSTQTSPSEDGPMNIYGVLQTPDLKFRALETIRGRLLNTTFPNGRTPFTFPASAP